MAETVAIKTSFLLSVSPELAAAREPLKHAKSTLNEVKSRRGTEDVAPRVSGLKNEFPFLFMRRACLASLKRD
jgi:hypothetical protein